MNINICVSLANLSFEECKKEMQEHDLVELRLDLLALSSEQITELLQLPSTVVATCRSSTLSNRERLQRLLFALEAGANYVDIEMEADQTYRQTLLESAKKNDRRAIISYHNFEYTPSKIELQQLAQTASDMGADVVKLVTTAHNADDAARVLSLYENNAHQLCAFAMGSAGKITRVAALFLGAPFTYASLTPATATAPGQLTAWEMECAYRLLSDGAPFVHFPEPKP